MAIYYKIAQPDGWDFYTGRTISYRDALAKGGLVRHPDPNSSLGLCSPGVLHASLRAEDCFQGGRIPCSLYRIEGNPAVPDDGTKAGFVELRVLEELDPAKHFLWRYAEACNPLGPLHDPPTGVTKDDLVLLEQWASVWASVRASVRASVWASVWDSVWASVRAYIGWIFAPVVTQWEGVSHQLGEYPFQASVGLWQRGLVASYDGRLWRLHSGSQSGIVYEARGR